MPVLGLAMLIVALGFSLMTPSLNSLVSLKVDAGVQGGMMGVTRSATTLARVLGPGWAGALVRVLGQGLAVLFAGALIMAGVIIIALALGADADARTCSRGRRISTDAATYLKDTTGPGQCRDLLLQERVQSFAAARRDPTLLWIVVE